MTFRARRLPAGWDKNLPTFPADAKGIATRESSGKVLNALAQNIPWLIGGSADLAKSNKVDLKMPGAGDFQADNYAGRNFHFGVREHGMAAAANGMAISRLRVFNATFFNFTDYMKPSMRLAALMEVPVIYVMTHDSIGVGEDGPTHQPIEQLAGLRAMPNMLVLRPGRCERSHRGVEDRGAADSIVQRRWCSRGSLFRLWIARNMRRLRESRRVLTYSPMLKAESRKSF